jgi:hypothetical protein
MFRFIKKNKGDKLYVAKHLIKTLLKDIAAADDSFNSALIALRLKDILRRLEK